MNRCTISILQLENTGSTHDYHNQTKTLWANVLEKSCEVRWIPYRLPKFGNWFNPDLIPLLTKIDGLILLNDLDYAILLKTYIDSDWRTKSIILEILRRKNHVAYCCEVIANSDLQTVGNPLKDKAFALAYFGNARFLAICNTRNATFLKAAGVSENVRLLPTYGYSPINGIVPLDESPYKPIDVLIYGNLHASFTYRTELINTVVRHCMDRGWTYVVTMFLDQDKIKVLRHSKVVVHCPSHDCETFPWAKAAELMARKVFFLIEMNDEVRSLGLEKTVATYARNDSDGLRRALDLYVPSHRLRAESRERCFEFIRQMYNMDEFIPKLIESLSR